MTLERMELLERFAQGELDAFEILFRQFQRQVHGWTLRLVRDPAVAEDLTVETFWRAHRARACFDPTRGGDPLSSFGGWVRRIATNLALDHLRRGRREVQLSAACGVAAAPSEPVVDRERREAIARAFGRLPLSLRAAATLALIEELPHADIAEALGISAGAVKHRVFRAVQLLRKRLEELGVKP
jgi:RNA polymerase sigma-70 factor, ECF subfamily